MMNDVKYRNEYIDFLRGIAAICIVAIHTAFWSGNGYTPTWFKSITLLVDVPFFFYLSGWSFSYNKIDICKVGAGLLNIWKKWIFFVTVISLFCFISAHFLPFKFSGIKDLKDLVNNYMFIVSIDGFRVIRGSIWFIPWYFYVVFFNSIVFLFLQNKENFSKSCKAYLYFIFFLFLWCCYHKTVFGSSALYFLFYSFFWVLGINRFELEKRFKDLFIVILFCTIGFALSSYLQGIDVVELQRAKFPPSLKYGFASLFVILISKYFGGGHSYNRFMIRVGRNAIFYYFAQGVGSSLVYYVVKLVSTQYWFLKWSIVFIVNLIITILIAEILKELYSITVRIAEDIKG